MIKRFTLLLSIATLLGLLTACSTANNTTAEAVENATTVDAPTEETKEVVETPTPEPTSEPDEVPTSDELKDTEDASKEFDEDAAYEKISRAVEAYDVLMNQNGDKEAENNAQFALMTSEVIDIPSLETLDGKKLIGNEIGVQELHDIYTDTLLYYYDNFVNKKGNYYDFAEYISSHTFDELVEFSSKMNKNDDGSFETSGVECFNIAWVPSLDGTLSIQNLTSDVTVKTNKVLTIDNGVVDAVYQCDIYMDDKDTGLKAVFDKDGNFLNFNDENAQIDMIIPFE